MNELSKHVLYTLAGLTEFNCSNNDSSLSYRVSKYYGWGVDMWQHLK